MRHAIRCLTLLTVAPFFLTASQSAVASPVTSTGPFVGNIQESWEGFDIGVLTNPTGIMDGSATIENDGAGGGVMKIYNTGTNSFGLGGSGTAQTADGAQGMGVNDLFPLPSTTTITLSTPVSAFGAYWAAATDGTNPATVTVTFFTSDNTSDTVNFQYYNASGALQWHGWSAALNETIQMIEYEGSGVVVDSLQALAAVPEPSTLVLFVLGLAGAAGCVLRRGSRH